MVSRSVHERALLIASSLLGSRFAGKVYLVPGRDLSSSFLVLAEVHELQEAQAADPEDHDSHRHNEWGFIYHKVSQSIPRMSRSRGTDILACIWF